MQCFEDLQVIGKGAYSVVYRARRKQDGQIYALKKVKLNMLAPMERNSCLNEIRLLAGLSHPNIIQYRDAFIENDSLNLVTEYAEHGDFLQLMMRRKKQHLNFSEQEFCVFAREMINGLNGLHRTKILHRDVKAANFFLCEGHKVKLGDMNVSSISRNGMALTKIGTPYYTSPEIWLELPYSFKSDIWSLGCLFFEMITFLHPFSGRDVAELKSNILNSTHHELPEDTPMKIRELIDKCLRKDPKERPSSDELLADEYLKLKYNQHKQRTMEKCLKNQKQYKLTCIRILREITQQVSNNIAKTQFPRSNYYSLSKTLKKKTEDKIGSPQKIKNNRQKEHKKISLRIMTMFNIYNQKPPGFLPMKTPQNTKTITLR